MIIARLDSFVLYSLTALHLIPIFTNAAEIIRPSEHVSRTLEPRHQLDVHQKRKTSPRIPLTCGVIGGQYTGGKTDPFDLNNCLKAATAIAEHHLSSWQCGNCYVMAHRGKKLVKIHQLTATDLREMVTVFLSNMNCETSLPPQEFRKKLKPTTEDDVQLQIGEAPYISHSDFTKCGPVQGGLVDVP